MVSDLEIVYDFELILKHVTIVSFSLRLASPERVQLLLSVVIEFQKLVAHDTNESYLKAYTNTTVDMDTVK